MILLYFAMKPPTLMSWFLTLILAIASIDATRPRKYFQLSSSDFDDALDNPSVRSYIIGATLTQLAFYNKDKLANFVQEVAKMKQETLEVMKQKSNKAHNDLAAEDAQKQPDSKEDTLAATKTVILVVGGILIAVVIVALLLIYLRRKNSNNATSMTNNSKSTSTIG